MRRGLLLGVVLLAGWPAGADAGWRVDRATAIAERVWGVCPGTLQIRFETPDDAWGDAHGWAWQGDCTVRINSWMGATYWEPFCTTVLHETGHVAGLGHSDNPKSVMRANATFLEMDGIIVTGTKRRRVHRWIGTDPRCRNRGRDYLKLG